MRTLFFALFALVGCSRERASPPSTDAAAPADSHSSSAAQVQACVSARVSLETFLVSLPTACTSASDCDGYYLRPSTCEPPLMLPKPGCPPERQTTLEKLQADARRTCPPDSNACSPRPFRADCRAGRCVNALAPPTMR